MKANQIDQRWRTILNQSKHNQRVQIEQQRQKDFENMPTVTERVTEYVLIRVPKRFAEAEWPAIMAAIKHYIASAYLKAEAWSSMRPKYKRILTLHVHLLMDKLDTDGYMHKIFKAVLGLPIYIWDNGPVNLPMPIDAYNMYFAFDELVMQSFRNNGKFSAASAFGIVLGCEAHTLFDIPVAGITEKVDNKLASDIIVIDDAYYKAKNLWEHIGKNLPNLKVTRIISYMNSFPAMIAALDGAKVVVGGLSMYTYLACCMNKCVYELYPEGLSKNWLSKWLHRKYMMYQGNIDNADYARVTKGVAMLWALQDRLSNMPVASPQIDGTQMEQSPSTAQSVGTA